MAWQKCPVCNGTGKNFISNCPTCNGHRIISEVTGLPPAFISYGTSSDKNVTYGTTTNDDENKKPPTSGGFNY